jgi:hypothetical protein
MMVKNVIAKIQNISKKILNKKNGQTLSAEVKRYKYFGTEEVRWTDDGTHLQEPRGHRSV